MFDQITPTTVLVWIATWLISKYLVPRIVNNTGKTKPKVKIVDKKDLKEQTIEAEEIEKVHQYRPFNSISVVTKNVTGVKYTNWLKLDERFVAKAKNIEAKTALNDKSSNQVCAAYNQMVQILADKYPNFFCSTGEELTNLANGCELPRKINGNAELALKLIALNVDATVRFYTKQNGKYTLQAYATHVTKNNETGTTDVELDASIFTLNNVLPTGPEYLKDSLAKCVALSAHNKYTQRLVWEVVPESKKLKVIREVYTTISNSLVVTDTEYVYDLSVIKEEGSIDELKKAVSGLPESAKKVHDTSKWLEVLDQFN